MYCEGSGRRWWSSMPPLSLSLSLSLCLRDFAAFSFCRLPSFTVVHPSRPPSFHSVSPLTIVSGRPAGRQAGPVVAKLKRSIWSCTVKLDEKKSKCAGLAQQIGFHSAKLHSLQWLVEGEASVCTCTVKKSVINECNKYDLSAAECFFLISPSYWLVQVVCY
jgi:hypothetical protein